MKIIFSRMGSSAVYHGRAPVTAVGSPGVGSWRWLEMPNKQLFAGYHGGGEFVDLYGPFVQRDEGELNKLKEVVA